MLATRRSIALLLLASCGSPASEVAPASSPPWRERVGERMRAEARAIREVDGRFVAGLPLTGLDGVFSTEGVRFAGDDGVPVLGIRLVAWGRADDRVPVTPVQPRLGACGPDEDVAGRCVRRLEYGHGALTEWWLGVSAGVEQGWTLASAPPGEGGLVFEVALDEALALDPVGGSVADARGESWTVSEVVAWDARGVALPAASRLVDGGLRVEVDDAGATYPVTVDPLYTTAAWTCIGAVWIDAVDSAGDVDGDGYDDVVVGASVAGHSGRAYLFRGSAAGVEETASATLVGESGSGFGAAVAGAGDIDGDGFEDVVVGADAWGDGAGRVYVFHGSAGGLDETAGLVIDGPSPRTAFGTALAGAGDIDGDGHGDVVVGGAGAAWVHFGSAAGLSSTGTALDAPDGSTFGKAVAGAGDVDGDGHDDVLVGAIGDSSWYGRVYLYRGGAHGIDDTPAATLTGVASSSDFGESLDGAGDVNGDGYDDVIVGASGWASLAGKVYVFHGSASGLGTTARTTLTAASTTEAFGYRVAGLGDVDGDGFADVAVGAIGWDEFAGRAAVYTGSSSGVRTTASTVIYGDEPEGVLGDALAGAGDVNGDGYDDLLVHDSDASGGGTAWVHTGGSSGVDDAGNAIVVLDHYVSEPDVSAAGDVNGDGFGDLAVGSPGYDDELGIVYVFHGSAAGLADVATTTLAGVTAGARFGERVVRAGDVDGDGFDDLLVWSSGYGNYAGRLSLFRGSADGLSISAETTLTGTSSYGRFGYAAIPAGDLDGDGRDDMVVGAPNTGVGGMVYVYAGDAAGLETSATATVAGPSGESFGYAVATGDFDGDGYADLAVGATGARSIRGAVYVYAGTADGLDVGDAVVTIAGETSGDEFGTALGAADLDGDGFADLVAGAPGYGGDVGRLYVFPGGASGLGEAPLATVTGGEAFEQVGSTFAVVPDVTGDSAPDVAVGHRSWSEYTGRVRVFAGGAGGLDTDAVTTLTGSVTYRSFGMAVADAGDVDGDGLHELVVASADEVRVYAGEREDRDGDGVLAGEDCDDGDAAVYPGAEDVWYDGVDGDCAGDDDFDADADGVGVDEDCDDLDPGAYPGAEDAWYDGVDADCDGADDYDADGDGVTVDTDCDDTDPAVLRCAEGDDDDPGSGDGKGGCGCASPGGAPGALGVAWALAVASRRRRVPSTHP